MTRWQIALVALAVVLLIADIIYTRKMIAAARDHIAQTRRLLRSMGYRDPEGDDEE